MINNNTISYPFTTGDLNFFGEWDESGELLIYEAYAAPGASTGSACWQIRKHTYNGSGKRLTTTFAGGVNDYNKIWDNRAGYDYS